LSICAGAPAGLSPEELEANDARSRDHREDESERYRRKAPSRISFQFPSSPEVVEDPGSGNDSPASEAGAFIEVGFLPALRAQLPNLEGMPDSFILRTPMPVLLKMESNAMKRSTADKSKNVEDKLLANTEKLASCRIQVVAGTDNRRDSLHPSRFMGAPLCPLQDLFLEGRRVIGPNGLDPVSGFDMAAVGMPGMVTPRGWVEIQNPGSTSLSLRLFSISNMGNRVAASRRITLAGDGADSLEVGENLKDVVSFNEFKLSLRTARVAQTICQPWNFSILALENFLLNNNFMGREVNPNTEGVATLSNFCDHVFFLNAEKYRSQKPFLDTVELGSVWATWFSGRAALSSSGAARDSGNRQQPSNSRKPARLSNGGNNGGNSGGNNGGSSNSQRQNNGSGGRGRQPASGSHGTGNSSGGSSGNSGNDICRRYNLNKCPNTSGPCITAAGSTLRHTCNFRLANGQVCPQRHQRSLNH
jgi:hypothetical protein